MHTLPDYMCQFVNLKVISKLTADKETVVVVPMDTEAF